MCDILIAAAKQLGAGLASSHVSVGPFLARQLPLSSFYYIIRTSVLS